MKILRTDNNTVICDEITEVQGNIILKLLLKYTNRNYKLVSD
jgi:hypothetical protein